MRDGIIGFILGFFTALLIAFHLMRAPEMDDEGNIITKTKGKQQ